MLVLHRLNQKIATCFWCLIMELLSTSASVTCKIFLFQNLNWNYACRFDIKIMRQSLPLTPNHRLQRRTRVCWVSLLTAACFFLSHQGHTFNDFQIGVDFNHALRLSNYQTSFWAYIPNHWNITSTLRWLGSSNWLIFFPRSSWYSLWSLLTHCSSC